MFSINGTETQAHVLLKNINQLDESSLKQLQNITQHTAFHNCNIVIMPDVHAGAGCVIGFTSTIKKKIVPNIIGVDIGCGVDAYNLGKIQINFESLDQFIKNNIPSGFNVRDNIYQNIIDSEIYQDIIDICNKLELNLNRVLLSIGSLGGGNHFIELDIDPNDNIWLVIHSGSRNFGLKIATHYQKIAKNEINKELDKKIYNNLEYLSSQNNIDNYLKDMVVAQEYAKINRETIANTIIDGYFKQEIVEKVSSIHNYINLENNIIRKGAISAYPQERLVIPLNMKEGCIIGEGRSTVRFNFSAPHGAGRIMSRTQAKKNLKLEDFQTEMKDVWSSTINKKTLDEAPGAYKPSQNIIDNINKLVDIKFIMKSIYNFKAC